MRWTIYVVGCVAILSLGMPSFAEDESNADQDGIWYFKQGLKQVEIDPQKARENFIKATEWFSSSYAEYLREDHNLRERINFYWEWDSRPYLAWGKALYLLDQTPEAILAFHRGVNYYAGPDPELRFALESARQKVEYPPGTVKPNDPWDNLVHQSRAGRYWLLALILYGFSFLGLTCWLTSGRRSAGIVTGLLALASMLATAGWVATHRQAQWDQDYPLVVVKEDKLPLRTGNGPSYPAHADLPVVRQGMEARRLRERGDWLQVQFPGDVVGWVPKAGVLVDEPSPVK